MLKVAFDPIYKYELPEGHRFPMLKYELLPEQLLYEGTLIEENFFRPTKLTHQELLLTHTPEYLYKLDNQLLERKEIIKIGFPMTPILVERGKYIAGGTYQAARFAKVHGVGMNIAGGTHHSFADHGEGFCVFNDIAIAANLMLARNEAKQILIIDLDVHQGNGTAKIFENEPRVFTFSMHGRKNYPLKKESSKLDIALEDGTEDSLYLSILGQVLSSLFDHVQPDFVFYLSGVDILSTDKLGRLSISLKGCKERDRMVFNECKRHGVPVAVSMGGGYSQRIADIIEAHANTFRLAQEIYF